MSRKPMKPIVVPPPTRRNPFAQDAAQRHAGVMKHRGAGRGGQRNEQRDLLEEWSDEGKDDAGHPMLMSEEEMG